MLSQKLDDMAKAFQRALDGGQPIDRAIVQCAWHLLEVYAEDARQLEGLTVPLAARRSAFAKASADERGEENIVDLDRFRGRRWPVTGGGGAA